MVPIPIKLLLVILILSRLPVKKVMELDEVATMLVVAPWSVRF